MIKVDEILMVIIGLLSLIIFYKIINGGLVEGAEGPSPTPPPLAVCCNPNASPKARCPGNDDGTGTTECPASGVCPPYDKKTTMGTSSETYRGGQKIKTCNEQCDMGIDFSVGPIENHYKSWCSTKDSSYFLGLAGKVEEISMDNSPTRDGGIYTCEESSVCEKGSICQQTCFCKMKFD